MLNIFDSTIKNILNEQLEKLENYFNADVIFFFGTISPYIVKPFRNVVEALNDNNKVNKLVLLLNTPGGSAEVAEKLAEIMRFHYAEVYFVIPDYALSAGTILCMSGDKIFMDYSSSLGPIDPQVYNGKEFVPALGYLDKVEELLKKAQNDTLTKAEFVILQNLDLALLRRHEQARELTITLLKKWLVEFKFKDWNKHNSNPELLNKDVTLEEKEIRATEIAEVLGNNKTWHSHERLISAKTLQALPLCLKIDDYSNDKELKELIRNYNDLITEYINRQNFSSFIHSRKHF